MKYTSISDFIIHLISSEETEYEKVTVELKNEIMEQIVKKMQDNCNN